MHSFDNYSFRAFREPIAVLENRDRAENKTDQNPRPRGVNTPVEQIAW